MAKMMSGSLISAAKSAAALTIKMNKLVRFDDTAGEDAMATLVISLAEHIEAMQEAHEHELEFTIRAFRDGEQTDTKMRPEWSMWRDDIESMLKKLRENPVSDNETYKMFGRVRQGREFEVHI